MNWNVGKLVSFIVIWLSIGNVWIQKIGREPNLDFWLSQVGRYRLVFSPSTEVRIKKEEAANRMNAVAQFEKTTVCGMDAWRNHIAGRVRFVAVSTAVWVLLPKLVLLQWHVPVCFFLSPLTVQSPHKQGKLAIWGVGVVKSLSDYSHSIQSNKTHK